MGREEDGRAVITGRMAETRRNDSNYESHYSEEEKRKAEKAIRWKISNH